MILEWRSVLWMLLALSLGGASSSAQSTGTDRIRPWSENPRYWQYRGKPVLLLGGSRTDHLFLMRGLEEHLDEMTDVGANYVRNTMSQREGKELQAYRLRGDGRFDLDEWNPAYWDRFRKMLQWTEDREIIVQIEVWDRFDFSRGNWEVSPWNPVNNVNYDSVRTGLSTRYEQHPARDLQPFFHSIPGMPRYSEKLDVVRLHQEKFVAKMLSISLDHGNVLYCMDNETSTPAAWGKYWIEFIQKMAADRGVTVCTTDMFDDAFEGKGARHTPLLFTDPVHYTFLDISQVNSRNYGESHWNALRWLLRHGNEHPRPTNHTKIYGSGYYSFGTGGPEDGVERFWRDLLGGSAGVRFHRPNAGNGLNDYAKASIKAARILEGKVRLWNLSPHMELLSDRETNEAYLAAKPGRDYVVYFTDGGSVGLDLSTARGVFGITWISVSQGITTRTSAVGGYTPMPDTIQGGRVVTLSAPYQGGWLAVLVRVPGGRRR